MDAQDVEFRKPGTRARQRSGPTVESGRHVHDLLFSEAYAEAFGRIAARHLGYVLDTQRPVQVR
jgi:hypothetical protein